MVNRSTLMALSLGALGGVGALYGNFTQAAPADAPSRETSAKVRPVAPPSTPASAAPSIASADEQRLNARRQLYETVDALVQASEFEKARQMLDEDQQRYGDDLAPEWREIEQSYRLIADCLERPSPKLRARALAFAQVSRAESYKSRIRAACSGSTPRGP